MEVIYDNKTGTQVLQLEKDCFYLNSAEDPGAFLKRSLWDG